MSTIYAQNGNATHSQQPTDAHVNDAQHRTHKILAVLGHEMRNPLSALSNALQLWPNAIHDPALMEELHGIILRQVQQLTSLSDDLLDVVRITEGKFELHLKQVDLQELIGHACEEVRPFVDRCGHTLQVDMPQKPTVLYGDSSRLLQVFSNLIQNAAKFTDQGGLLNVTVGSHGNAAIVRVRDNGRGLEARVLETIFEPFAQIDIANGATNCGLGLGLPLVKTIVERHGGDVSAHSAGLGLGSEFTVRLPLFNRNARVDSFP
ncbi:MAG: HAMP domain-containing sensor histidine kinase [Planctomycetia bacterium]|nr:HAMP domain-containing sensor histidine kinase [Planctomycetia bacterium]